MAIDSRNKRGSAIGVNPASPVLPNPDGGIGAGDRAQTAHIYSGLFAPSDTGSIYLLTNTAGHSASSIGIGSGSVAAASGYSLNDLVSGPRSTLCRTAASTLYREAAYVFDSDVTTTHMVVARADWLLTQQGNRVRPIQRSSGGVWSVISGVDYNPLAASHLVGPRGQDLVFAISPAQLRGVGLNVDNGGGATEAMQLSKLYASSAFDFGVPPRFEAQAQPLPPNTFSTPPDRGFPYDVEQRFTLVFELITVAKFAEFEALPQIRSWPLFLYDPAGNLWDTKLEHVIVEDWVKQNRDSGRCDLTVTFLRLRHYD